MDDLFANLFEQLPIDPLEAARRGARPPLPRRFYATVGFAPADAGFRILLDGRPIRTPARHVLEVPARPLAEAIAAEWDAQAEVVDPARMPLTRLANSIVDGVMAAPGPVAAEVAKYLSSDLLFYRAEAPQELVERQSRLWDPVIDWMQETFGTRFVLSAGVVFVAQSEAALARASAAIPSDPWRLGAAHVITTLTGSALLALAVLGGRLAVEDAWQAALVDEDWNTETWGRDELASERQAARFVEMRAAGVVLAALNDRAEASGGAG